MERVKRPSPGPLEVENEIEADTQPVSLCSLMEHSNCEIDTNSMNNRSRSMVCLTVKNIL